MNRASHVWAHAARRREKQVSVVAQFNRAAYRSRGMKGSEECVFDTSSPEAQLVQQANVSIKGWKQLSSIHCRAKEEKKKKAQPTLMHLFKLIKSQLPSCHSWCNYLLRRELLFTVGSQEHRHLFPDVIRKGILPAASQVASPSR